MLYRFGRTNNFHGKNFLIPLAVVFIAMVVGLPLSADGIDEKFQKILAAQSEISSLQSPFTQTKKLSLFEDTLVSEGTIVIEKPDFYCWVYEQPDQSVFYVDGLRTGSLDRATGQRQETSLEDSLGLAGIIQSITPIISGNLNEASQLNYRITRNPATGDLWSYSLHPLQPELQTVFNTVTIRFDSKTRLARDLTIEEKNGDSTHITFAEWQLNIPVDRSLLTN